MAAVPEDPAERLRDVVGRIAEALGLDAEVEVTEEDDALRVVLAGDELGLFIGRHGQTIDAVQHLSQRIAYPGSAPARRRVIVDAAGYRERRAAVLQRQADQAAEDALRTGRPVALDAMGPTDRRIVHEHLRERGDVETHSEGEEPDRHLVVSPLGS
jgi:spoIIIJ-associated protein